MVRVRFAPSPTGKLHLGGLRTALYDYAYAKNQGGKFILRIEDTDQSRLVQGATENLVNSLRAMGLDFDEGPTFQSQRLEIYKKYALRLIEQGDAYYCFCTQQELDLARQRQKELKLPTKYPETCRNLPKEEVAQKLAKGASYVVRLKMPKDKDFVIFDKVRGKVKIDSSLLDDQVILKSDGFPTYHLAAVVDDHLMEISHVIRGEEWLYSTPKHIHLYDCLGWKPPTWVHLPLILNQNKAKLSKRDGDFSVEAYLEKGYLPEAIINFVALLGWNPKTEKEIFDLQYLCDKFSFKAVNKAGAVFDERKLEWMNGQYIRKMDVKRLAKLLENYFVAAQIDISDQQKYLKVIDVAKDYLVRLPQVVHHAKMFYQELEFEQEDLPILHSPEAQAVFSYYLENLKEGQDYAQFVKEASATLGIKGKAYFFPLRLALFGSSSGPNIPVLLDILGVEGTKQRLSKVLL